MAFLWWAVAFFVLAIIAAALGFGEIGGLTIDIAKWLVIIFVVLAIIALILSPGASGDAQPADNGSVETPPVSEHGGIDRYVDEEAGVVCYGYYNNGISCLPINQTRLGG